jgi:hypothetical protein
MDDCIGGLLVQLGQDKQVDNMFKCKKERPMDGRYR